MLTFISVPKAFSGATATAQENAIQSWARLSAHAGTILFGDDPGVAEAAVRFGARHEGGLARTPQGTPTLSEVFARADMLARGHMLCFVNTDTVLLEDFVRAATQVASYRKLFLMIASRFNCRIDGRLFFEPGWDENLRHRVRREARMYPAGGSDIFVYPPGLFQMVPPFAVGRGFWDNWLMYEARRQGASLIDATRAATVVHQEHSYRHITGLPEDSRADMHVYETEEGQQNLQLAGGKRCIYTAYDATEILTASGQLLSTLRPTLIYRRLKASLRRALD